MGKKFLLSSILAAILLENSYAITMSNLITKNTPIENNITKGMFAENEIIITFKDDSDISNIKKSIASMFSNATQHEYNVIKAIHLKVPSMAYDIIKSKLEEKFKDKIKTIEPNYAFSYNKTSNDTYYDKLWAIENTGQSINGKSGTNDADMDVKEAWDKTKGSSDVVVAVLDTGVDYTHSDLADNMWNGAVNHGYDFAGDDDGNNDNDPIPDTPYDDNGHYHGTHVAGIIGAVGDNENGVSGIAQNVQIMAIKVFRPNGYGYTSDILEGLDYVSKQIDNGVNVVAINASYGGSGGSAGDSMDQAIQKLGDKGVVFVAAAGNDGKNIDEDPVYPASYSATNIITVAASDQDDNLASFSNYGKNTVEVAAPGTNILSTYPDNKYAYLQGTSMATPNVTGTVALLASISPNSSVEQRIDAIEKNTDKPNDLNDKVANGRVNANKAVNALEENNNNTPIAKDDTANTDEDNSIVIDVLQNDSDADKDTIKIKSITTPSHGKAEIIDNKVKYTPNKNYNGDDNFKYTISDGNGGEDSAKVTINIKAINDAPIAKDDSAKTKEDTKVTIDVLKNDSDIDGDSLTIKSVSNASNGKVKIVNNKIEYTPNKDYNGEDSFEYTISDGNGADTKAKVAIKIEAVNDAPIASDASKTTNEDNSVDIKLSANDVDNDKLKYKITKQPKNGSVSINGSIATYKPNNNYNGKDSFSFIANDGKEDSNEATVTITIKAINDKPVAKDDNAQTDYEKEVTIDVLSNDSDVDNDKLTIESVSNPKNGTATIQNGKIKYKPNNGFSGNDKFEYTISDGNAKDTATVNVVVNSKDNNKPIAKDDSAKTKYETKVIIDVLKNDSDADGDSLTIKSVSSANNGKVEIVNNKIEYTPNSKFSGNDSFNYTISDNKGGEDTAKVTVIVEEKPNSDPIAKDDNAKTEYETKVIIDVLKNDSDADGDKLIIKSVSTPKNGKAVIKNGKIEYTPNSKFSGDDSFNYTISDNKGGEDVAKVTVTVNKKKEEQHNNHWPIPKMDGTFFINKNSSKELDVLSNDSDPDGDNLKIKSVTKPSNGKVKITNDGKLIYTPNKDYTGSDSFYYTVSDEFGATAQAKVTIMVTGNNNDNEYSFPVIGDKGIEKPTKIIGKFIKEIKGNIYSLKLIDAQGSIEVNKNNGKVQLKDMKSPMPTGYLPAGSIIKVENKKLEAKFSLTTNIKFK